VRLQPICVPACEENEPTVTAESAPRHMTRHPVQICLEPRLTRVVLPCPARQREKRILRDVLCDPFAAAQQERSADRFLVSTVQRDERVAVTRQVIGGHWKV
jgi:hypothetical protein